MPNENYIDHTPFISPHFQPNAYANAILAGEVYDPDASHSLPPAPATTGEASGSGKGKAKAPNGVAAGGMDGTHKGTPLGQGTLTVKGDVGVALAKLNYGIEDVTKQLRREITQNHPLLLSHLHSTSTLSTSLTTIRTSLSSLSTSLTRLHTKIHDPYTSISTQVDRLSKIRSSSEVLRRLARVLVLVRRLDGQMKLIEIAIQNGDKADAGKKEAVKERKGSVNAALGGLGKEEKDEGSEKEREMIKAALTLAELESLLDPASAQNLAQDDGNAMAAVQLTELDAVRQHIPQVNNAREVVIVEMENMVVSGLANLNQPLLSTSLQTAYNLRLLPQLVVNLLADLNDAVEARISKVFDMASIGKEVASKEQPSTASAATSLIYRRNKAADSTPNNSNVQIWTQVVWHRFELLIDDIANCCIKVYTLEKVLRMKRDPATGTEFLEEVMKTLEEKPSFTFWTTLATAFDTKSREAANANNFLQQTLSTSYPRLLRLLHEFFAKIAVHTDTVYTQAHQSPETVLILRSVSKFEQAYLARSTGRMTESINASFAGGVKMPPTATDGIAIFRIMLNELDSARFDPLMSSSVARGVARAVEGVATRVDGILVKDFSATSLIGPSASSAQILNGSLISCVYHLTHNLRTSTTDFPPKVREILAPALEAATKTFERPIESLNIAIKREISTIVARIHKVDFSKPVDPMSMGGNGSPYMVDLADKMGFLRTEILGRMNLGDRMKEWVTALTKHTIHAFLLNASITRPLGETGKLKLTSDMTQLEFALGTFLTTGTMQGARNVLRLEQVGGDEYKALRAFRTVLFLDSQALAHPEETVGLPPLIVLHHIIVLSPLLLPHQVHKWSEAEYILWVDKHEDKECWKLLGRAVDAQKEAAGEEEWRTLIKEVLKHCTEA